MGLKNTSYNICFFGGQSKKHTGLRQHNPETARMRCVFPHQIIMFNPQCRIPIVTIVFFLDENRQLSRSKVIEQPGSETKIRYLGYNSKDDEIFDFKSIWAYHSFEAKLLKL